LANVSGVVVDEKATEDGDTVMVVPDNADAALGVTVNELPVATIAFGSTVNVYDLPAHMNIGTFETMDCVARFTLKLYVNCSGPPLMAKLID